MKRMNKGMLVWSRLLVSVAALLVFLLPGTAQSSQEQQTGFFYDAGATDGLTLFAAYRGIGSYLVDTSGTVVQRWFDPDGLTAGASVYLSKAGTLLKAVNSEGGQGDGGRIREYLKDGTCIWEFRYDKDSEPPAAGQQHHDFEELPNGNLLVTAKEGDEDTILEIKRTGELNENWDPKPEYPGTGVDTVDFFNTCKYVLDGALEDFEPEWKWNSGDHRGEGPREIDETAIDDVNFNHIDYLPARDHILVSCNECNEVFIIDHKPSTEQAAGEAGDLLWRWGTPSNYGAEGEPLLAFTHSAHWIYDKDSYGWSGYKDTDIGDIILLNNRDPQLCDEPCTPAQAGFSSIVQITPPWNEMDENYGFLPEPGVAFEPSGFKRRIVNFSNDGTTFDIDSDFQGSAHLLPHGRIMMSIGAVNNNNSTGKAQGDIYEIQSDQFGASAVSVWRYVNPFVPPEEFWPQNNGPKGEDIELPEDQMVKECDENNFGFECNCIFRGIKYAPSFEGFDRLKCYKKDIHCDFSELYPGVPLTDHAQAAKLHESCYLSVMSSGTTMGTAYADPPINVFDSSDIESRNPRDDPDLGSPNRACGRILPDNEKGPGRGKGGKPFIKEGGVIKPNPFQNCEPLGNLLIIQNENINVLDKANDSFNGGCMDFNMWGPGHVKDFGLLDIEESPGATITFYHNNDEVGSILSPLMGNNGHWRASDDYKDYLENELPVVDRIKVCLPGSGAVSFINLELEVCGGQPDDE